jgi:hypothetical protein
MDPDTVARELKMLKRAMDTHLLAGGGKAPCQVR